MSRFISSLFSIGSFIVLVLILLTSSKETLLDKSSTAIDKSKYNLPQVVKAIPRVSTPTFAGEKVPVNIDTKERLDRELTVNSYWHSSTLLNIKLSKKYFPIIEPILKSHGVPDDFKYLAVAESGLRNVTSPASAKGFWQFRQLAAKEWGLEVNREVDERYHIEKSTEAACKYLIRLKERFGSWANAAAAYNVGPTKFSRILRDQKENSYYDLNLNDETARYVFRLIAIKEVLSNPEAFGFYINPEDQYDGFDDTYEVFIDETVEDWSVFAEEHGVSYRLLKYYNPWLISDKLTVINNTYHVKLPKS